MSEHSRRSISGRIAVLVPILLSFLCVATLLAPARPAQARLFVHKLSGALPAGASVNHYATIHQISPDSQWVVYSVTGDPTGSFDLYSVPIHGGDPVRLTQPGFNGRAIWGVHISPDSSRVVYVSDALVNDKNELFSVPIDGSSNPLRISSSGMIAAGDVSSTFFISPDSARVIYRADQAVNEQFNLYSVPIGGGTITQLNHALSEDADVQNIRITPDGQRVVFQVIDEVTNLSQLYFTPIAEQNVRRLDGGPSEGVKFLQFVVLPDSSGVVYSANQESYTASDLYRADFYSGPSQPPPVRLTDAPAPSSLWGGVTVTPDGGYVVLAANYTPGSNPEYWRARTHPIGSNDVVRLHPAFGMEKAPNFGARVTPDGQGAVFVLLELATGKNILYSNTIASPVTPYQLSHTPSANNTGFYGDIGITPNNLGVVFLSDVDENETFRLYSNWITGGAPISLTPILTAGGDVHNFQIAPDSLGVVFLADGLTNDQVELFVVPTVGPWTAAARLNSPMANADGDVIEYLISPDGKVVTYVADAETEGINELYVVEDLELRFLPLLMR